jgi:hypothetical protein
VRSGFLPDDIVVVGEMRGERDDTTRRGAWFVLSTYAVRNLVVWPEKDMNLSTVWLDAYLCILVLVVLLPQRFALNMHEEELVL